MKLKDISGIEVWTMISYLDGNISLSNKTNSVKTYV